MGPKHIRLRRLLRHGQRLTFPKLGRRPIDELRLVDCIIRLARAAPRDIGREKRCGPVSGDGGWNPRILDLAIAAGHMVTDPNRLWAEPSIPPVLAARLWTLNGR